MGKVTVNIGQNTLTSRVHELTLVPGKCFVVSKLMAVSPVVRVAVKIDVMQMPIKIHSTANIRATREWGARSPYLRRKRDSFTRGFPGHE